MRELKSNLTDFYREIKFGGTYKKPFYDVASKERHLNWNQLIKRESGIYPRSDDIRS